MARLAEALAAIAARPDVLLVLPLHPNPAAAEPLAARLAGLPRVRLLPPLPYPAMVRLLSAAVLLLTDSGGLAEEAPALGLPTLILRERTERPEAIAAGAALLAGTDPAGIAGLAHALLEDEARRAAMAVPRLPLRRRAGGRAYPPPRCSAAERARRGRCRGSPAARTGRCRGRSQAGSATAVLALPAAAGIIAAGGKRCASR